MNRHCCVQSVASTPVSHGGAHLPPPSVTVDEHSLLFSSLLFLVWHQKLHQNQSRKATTTDGPSALLSRISVPPAAAMAAAAAAARLHTGLPHRRPWHRNVVAETKGSGDLLLRHELAAWLIRPAAPGSLGWAWRGEAVEEETARARCSRGSTSATQARAAARGLRPGTRWRSTSSSPCRPTASAPPPPPPPAPRGPRPASCPPRRLPRWDARCLLCFQDPVSRPRKRRIQFNPLFSLCSLLLSLARAKLGKPLCLLFFFVKQTVLAFACYQFSCCCLSCSCVFLASWQLLYFFQTLKINSWLAS